MKFRKIKTARGPVRAYEIKLLTKNLILFRGTRGFVMCGYLDLRTAEKFQEVAVKIVGVASITQALKTTVFAGSRAARKIGIFKGQAIKETLELIA